MSDQNRNRGGTSAAAQTAELPNDPQTWLVFYDDQDRRPELFTERSPALRRFDDISSAWNAHLFVRVHANCRDARQPGEADNLRDALARFRIPAPGPHPSTRGDFAPGKPGAASLVPAKPFFLFSGDRFRIRFNAHGGTSSLRRVFGSLDGRWVALVAAEDDSHTRPPRLFGAMPYLLNGIRFKLSFDGRGKTRSFDNFRHELEGRWVALVAAENDQHLAHIRAPAEFMHLAGRMRAALDKTPGLDVNGELASLLGEIEATYR